MPKKKHNETTDYVEVRDTALDQLDDSVSAYKDEPGRIGHEAISLVQFLHTRIQLFLDEQHEFGVSPDLSLQHAVDTVQAWLDGAWPLVETPSTEDSKP